MRGFNRAIIAGNLTRDPEVRYTVNKRAYARFGVAVNSRWKNANGEIQENTEFFNVVAWGATAETCGKYLKKGSPVLIEGRLQTSTYEAKDGSGKRTSTDIVVENMNMLSSGPQGGNSGGGNFQRGASQDFNNNNGAPSFAPTDDDFGGSIQSGGFGEDFSQGLANNNAGQSEENSCIPF